MWIKRIISIVLALVAVVILAAVALTLFVDPNHYKPLIIDAVHKKTDRTLSIDGNMSWRFWPGIGIEIDDVTLSNAPGFGNTPFVKMGEASVYIRLLPLLTKKIYIDKLEIKDADIYLARHFDGKTNWSDLVESNEATQEVKVNYTPNTEPQEKPQALNLKIAALNIINSRLTWDDQMQGQTRVVSDFSFSGGLGAGGMQPFKTQGVADLKPENIQYVFDADGKYALDLNAQSFEGKNWKATTQVTGVKNIPQAEKITLAFDSLVLDMPKGNFAAEKLVLQAMGGEVNFSGEGENIFKAPSINGSLSARNIDVKAIAMLLNQPIETTDPNVLRKINIEAKALGSENRVTFDPIHIVIDDTELNGQIAINDWQKKEIAFALAGNQINLDRYMPPKKSATSAAPSQNSGSSAKKSDDIISPATDNTLRTLKMGGHLTMGSLTMQKMVLSNVVMDVEADNGILKISPFKTNLYEGNLVANVMLNVKGAQPQWSVDAQLSKLNLSPMLKQLEAKEVMSGRFSLNGQLQTTGRSSQAMLQALDGTATFNIDNGVLQGIDLGYWLAVGEGLANKKLETAITVPNTKQTRFLVTAGNFLIRNGIANNQNLVMYNESVYMQGAGQFNLVRETLDYAVRVDKTHLAANGRYESSGKGIPLRITGTFSQPTVSVDIKGLRTNLIRGLIGEKLNGKLLGGESSSSESGTTTNTDSTDSSSSTTQTPEQQAREKLKNIFKGL